MLQILLILIDFDSLLGHFLLRYYFHKTVITLELEKKLRNSKRWSPWFRCSFKFSIKKTFHFNNLSKTWTQLEIAMQVFFTTF